MTIEECQRLIIPIKTTPTGSRCSNPYGKLAENFSKKIALGRIDLGTKLACADLLKCFGCEHQVIVQSVDDIWCLLSFRTCIEESLYLHLDEEHFEKNFNKVVSFINLNILQRIDKKILSQAESKLDNYGKHPLWKEV